jgi:hypothetical protein
MESKKKTRVEMNRWRKGPLIYSKEGKGRRARVVFKRGTGRNGSLNTVPHFPLT